MLMFKLVFLPFVSGVPSGYFLEHVCFLWTPETFSDLLTKTLINTRLMFNLTATSEGNETSIASLHR